MEIFIYIVLPSFLFGFSICYFGIKKIQSSEYKKHIAELLKHNVDAEFDMGGGIKYQRPYRFGLEQAGSKSNNSALSKLFVIRHDGYIEIYGSWDRNNKNQIDPFSLHLPIGFEVIHPDNIVAFGQYFIELGNELNQKLENR
jgi:hypothetical protein